MSLNSVYASLVGGLGNQLFQLATANDLATKINAFLYADISNWTAHQGESPLKYKDNIFQNFSYHAPFTRDIIGYHEKRFNYDEIPTNYHKVRLNGYFQSLKYFEETQEEFKKYLILPKVNTSCIPSKNVAFHIRRGDYLTFKDVHCVCDAEYFNKCFDMFDDYHINVFTDSPEYVLEEFKHQDFNLIQTTSELNDLTLMSLHDNMVISNSSFSWWASFLGKKKERIISPSKWFADGREATDIFRNEFIKI